MSSAISTALRYHHYLYRKLRPYLGSRVWEIGSGYGQYTEILLEDKRTVLASDIDVEMLEQLSPLRAAYPEKVDFRSIDLQTEESVTACMSWNPDSIFCVNVLEHIKDDVEALRWIHRKSAPGTRAIFLTPAHQKLFGFMDSEAGHFRRYSRKDILTKFATAGWTVETCFYINPVGGIGWFVRNHLVPPKSRGLDDPRVNRDIEVFDKYCVPITEFLDPFFRSIFGQSVIVVAVKTAASTA